MSALSPSATPSFSTTVFGDAAAAQQTALASAQGAVYLYQSSDCSDAISDTPTPLILGECRNAPFTGIGSVSITSLPSCSDNGTPLLIVTDLGGCENSTIGAGADSGVPGKCLSYDGQADIGSMGFVCYGDGVVPESSSAAAAATSFGVALPSAAATSAPADPSPTDSGDDDEDSGDSYDCCICVVM